MHGLRRMSRLWGRGGMQERKEEKASNPAWIPMIWSLNQSSSFSSPPRFRLSSTQRNRRVKLENSQPESTYCTITRRHFFWLWRADRLERTGIGLVKRFMWLGKPFSSVEHLRLVPLQTPYLVKTARNYGAGTVRSSVTVLLLPMFQCRISLCFV